jgi:glycerol-3-phosphate dehydrogenase (NAD(P)+)
MRKIGIIGGGSWATAIVKVLSQKSVKMNWWIRKPETVSFIKSYQHNPDYLSYVHLNTEFINMSNDFNRVVKNSEILLWVIPAAFLHSTISVFDLSQLQKKLHVSLVKGIIPEFNCTVTEYLNSQYNVPSQNFAMIAGPCHAEEVAMEKLSVLTVASTNQELSSILPEMLTCRYIKVNIVNDLRGVEYAAVLKNIFAVAAGICSGLGYGDNFQSILIVNAIKEAKRFLENICPTKRDIMDSVYTGDIVVTAYSQFSRNRVFGTLIGKGYSVQYSMIEMKMVAEGYYAVKGVRQICREMQIEMPIIEAVYNILYEQISPSIEMKLLAERLS